MKSVVVSLALWGMIASGTDSGDMTDTPVYNTRKVESDRKWRRIYNSTIRLDSLNKVVKYQDSIKRK